MSHPIHLVRRFENRVASGHYRGEGEKAANHYRARTEIDPYERIGQLTSTKKKLSDKLALVRDIVGRAVGCVDISDDDALSILVGWAAENYHRYPDLFREEVDWDQIEITTMEGKPWETPTTSED
jgi:hypothetical protein